MAANILPIIALVGRPNVGKSTLFNRLTQTQDALVADMPGVTRDRQYGLGVLGDRPYHVIDTGGLIETDDPALSALTHAQVEEAIAEADLVLFMVDAKAGATAADREIAQQLRPLAHRVMLVVNKVDRDDAAVLVSEFYELGFGQPCAIAAHIGRGLGPLIREALAKCPLAANDAAQEEQHEGIKIAMVGRPNVGKSTLINRLLGEERVIVFDQPGTTRDSIFIPFERRGEKYILIDTAGVRRRSKVQDVIEKYSIVKTLRAIDQSHVVVFLVDAQAGVTEQDLRLLGMVVKAGKALIIAINKWDNLDEENRSQLKAMIDRRFQFVTFARYFFISALHGTGVGHLYEAIHEAYAALTQEISTADLTRQLLLAIEQHQPPLVQGRRVKLRYAHLGGRNPLQIIIHGKQVEDLPTAYQRYLASYFRQAFHLVGVPLILKMKNDRNPYG